MSLSRPTYVWPEHKPWESGWLVSALRGLRNAIVTGARIRLPYILQALVFFALYGSNDKSMLRRLQFVLKQAVTHGRDLGLFVLIYKSCCSILRYYGLKNGMESWIAGFIGGYYGFGDSKGIRGSVNFQIVLYLFSRGIAGTIKGLADDGVIPAQCDITRPPAFRYFAGFSLALILYLTEHRPDTLRPSFIKTMKFLYHDSDKPPNAPPLRYALPVIIVFISLFIGTFYKPLSLERMLGVLDFPASRKLVQDK